MENKEKAKLADYFHVEAVLVVKSALNFTLLVGSSISRNQSNHFGIASAVADGLFCSWEHQQ